MGLKKLWKYFLILFLASFIAINWSEVSWVFNYKEIYGIASDFFQKEEQKAVPDAFPANNENLFEYLEKENSIEIPKIDILAPLVFAESADNKEIGKDLNEGAVVFPNSVMPGSSGQTTVLGHSAPSGWPKTKYEWIFSQLDALTVGDEIFVYFNHKKYFYSVTQKIFLEKGGEIPENLTSSDSMLVLISCWPPGKDIRRIAVLAKLNNEAK